MAPAALLVLIVVAWEGLGLVLVELGVVEQRYHAGMEVVGSLVPATKVAGRYRVAEDGSWLGAPVQVGRGWPGWPGWRRLLRIRSRRHTRAIPPPRSEDSSRSPARGQTAHLGTDRPHPQQTRRNQHRHADDDVYHDRNLSGHQPNRVRDQPEDHTPQRDPSTIPTTTAAQSASCGRIDAMPTPPTVIITGVRPSGAARGDRRRL
jgi:hypothetical protein